MKLGDAAYRSAAAARFALVAGLVNIREVEAPRALAQIAAIGGLVAQLLCCPGQNGAREHRIVGTHARMDGGLCIRGERAEPQAAVVRVLDIRKAQPVDVRKLSGLLHLQLHQVEQIGPACNRKRIFACGHV